MRPGTALWLRRLLSLGIFASGFGFACAADDANLIGMILTAVMGMLCYLFMFVDFITIIDDEEEE